MGLWEGCAAAQRENLERMMDTPLYSLKERIDHLNRIGLALTREHDLQALLELIVSEARALARADGGSLYLVQNGKLWFTVAQNETLSKRLGEQGEVKRSFVPFPLELNKETLAGYVACTGGTLNIEDAYTIPQERDYHFSPKFDQMNNYRTKSMLLVPMRDRHDQVAGVLCLVNAVDGEGNSVRFSKQNEDILSSIASQAMAAIENARLFEKLKTAYMETILCLSMAAEQRDTDTGAHVRRISEYSGLIAQRLGLPESEVDRLRYASPLHDVGKIGIPDSILLKPGKLTPEEYEVMKTHTTIGAEILKGDAEYIVAAREIALTHHEKVDGTGYPNKLKGNDIPLVGRIVAVADVFDALVSKRVYKPSMSPEEARNLILRDTGKHFCPQVSQVFEKYFADIVSIRQRFQDDSGDMFFSSVVEKKMRSAP